MAYNKTIWENLPSTNTPINETNLNNIEDGIETLEQELSQLQTTVDDLIQFENVSISLTTVANGFVYKSGTFTIPAGYILLSANIVSNGWLSEVLTSIINISNPNITINAYSNSVKNVSVSVRMIYLKNI